MKKTPKYLAIACLATIVIIQFVPVELPENNSDSSIGISHTENAPDEIKLILSKSCYDCHSNQTIYPWYSKVAPVSWLVARDIRLGRDEVNFSEWGELSKRKKIKILSEIAEKVEEKTMPLRIYTFVHKDAILTQHEIETLSNWTKSLTDNILDGD